MKTLLNILLPLAIAAGSTTATTSFLANENNNIIQNNDKNDKNILDIADIAFNELEVFVGPSTTDGSKLL